MKKASYYLSAMLLVASFSQQPASAQFEGKITFNSYNYSSEGVEHKDDNFTLFITPDRILLQGEKEYGFMESIQTEGVLVRLDFEDFVFLTGDNEALKISKSDITSMMNMFGNGQNATKTAEKADNVNYERTGESATIHGYEADKFIFRDNEEPNEHTEVWMTNQLDVNWGMLAESWSGSADMYFGVDDRFDGWVGERVVLAFYIDDTAGTLQRFEGWGIIGTKSTTVPVDGLVEQSIDLEGQSKLVYREG